LLNLALIEAWRGVRIPTQVGHRFRWKSAGDSDLKSATPGRHPLDA
jgi:hypothetical protein